MKPEKRQTIMRAAEALFSRRRFHEITMDEVAREAGVGKGTIYRYFANKEELYFEVALAAHDALCELVEAEAAREGSFGEKLSRVSAAVGDFFQRRHRAWNLMQAEDRRQLMGQGKLRDSWCQRRARLREALVGVFETGLASGEIRSDVPVSFLVGALLGLLREQSREAGTEGVGSVSLLVDLFLNGARSGATEAVE
jgi:AcrR family transcriptional regulator